MAQLFSLGHLAPHYIMSTETMTTYIAIFDELHPPTRQQHPGLFALFDANPGYARLADHLHLFQHTGNLEAAWASKIRHMSLGSVVVVVECGRAAWPSVPPERNRTLEQLFGRNFLET